MVVWSQVGAVWAVTGLLLGGVALMEATGTGQAPSAVVHAWSDPATPSLYAGDPRLSGVLPPGLGIERLEGEEPAEVAAAAPEVPVTPPLVLALNRDCAVVTQ